MGRILVTGGTGELGRAVVRRLVRAGQAIRVLSRQAEARVPPGVEVAQGDLATGIGLTEAVSGVETIVHCASDPRRPRPIDIAGTARLCQAATAAGVSHLVYISIVGVDRHPFPYYRAKLAAETIVQRGSVPWTILRATQFHSLLLYVLQRQDRLPVLLVPRGFRFQSIDSGEVAARLVEVALGEPARRILELGGPRVRTAEDLAHAYQVAAVRHAPILRLPIPGRVARAFRVGVNLAPTHADGALTWEDYLQERFGVRTSPNLRQ